MIKELCENAFERAGEKRTFYLALDEKYKTVVAKIKKEEKYDRRFTNKLDYVCRLKKINYYVPKFEIPEEISEEESISIIEENSNESVTSA